MSRAARACLFFACVVAAFENAAAEEHPAAAVRAFNLGVEKHERGDLDGAIADYTKAIEIDPRFGDPYQNRGVARRAKGDLDGAIADYSKAIEINPRDKEPYASRGVAKSDKGDL